MDGLIAVVAHGMRNTVAVIHGMAAHLEVRWDRLTAEQRAEALDSLVTQTDQLAGSLDALPPLLATRLGNHCFVIAETACRVARHGGGDAAARVESLQAIVRQCGQIDRLLAQVMRPIPQPVLDELDGLDGRDRGHDAAG